MSSSLMPYAIRKNARSHSISQLSGIFCPARVARRSDQFKAVCNHPRRNESEQQKTDPSLYDFLNISGAIRVIVATTIARTVTRVMAAEVFRTAFKRLTIVSATSV